MTWPGPALRPRRAAAVAALFWALAPAQAAAETAEAARAFVVGLVEETRRIGAGAEPPAQKAARYRDVVGRHLKIGPFGEYAAGSHWQAMSADQRRRYLGTLGRLAVDVVVSGLLRRGVVSYTVAEVRAVAARDWLVATRLTDRRERETTVFWRVRQLPEGAGIVDVLPQGLSLALTRRREIASFMRRDGATLEDLLRELEQRAQRAAAVRGGDD